jgi:FtsZ-binding cell division protein ZapB
MKYFPLKILLLLVVLMLAAHFTTVHLLERYLVYRYTREIENIYIGDTAPLFAGRLSLNEAVGRNIETFLQKRSLVLLGAVVDVRVTSGDTWVYPAPISLDEDMTGPLSAAEVAAENYRLMNQGLSVTVRMLMGWNAALVLVIFAFYFIVAAGAFLWFYRAGARRAKREAGEKENEIQRLRDQEKRQLQRAAELNQEKERLARDIADIKKNLLEYKTAAGRNEDAMIDEMIALEEKIQKNIALAEALRLENEALKESAQRFQNEKQRGSKKSVLYGNIEKRFKTLYKNIFFHKRFFDGFLDLVDDMKIKAEEAVKQINENPSAVNIKRKVDLQKSREKVFEVIFAYNGRLYFRNTKDGRVEVLAVGNKNTQIRDLGFLDTL